MFSQKKINSIISKIAKKYKLPTQVVEAVFRSQFEVARAATEEKKNIRFPFIGLLYQRENKNPKYLKHRKKWTQEQSDKKDVI